MTQVIVEINSNLTPETQLSRVVVEVRKRDGGKPVAGTSFALVAKNPSTEQLALPVTFSVVKDTQPSFLLAITGSGPLGTNGVEETVIEYKAVVTFETGKTLLLPVFLDQGCLQVICNDPQQACFSNGGGPMHAGSCGPVMVNDSSNLQSVNPEKIPAVVLPPMATSEAHVDATVVNEAGAPRDSGHDAGSPTDTTRVPATPQSGSGTGSDSPRDAGNGPVSKPSLDAGNRIGSNASHDAGHGPITNPSRDAAVVAAEPPENCTNGVDDNGDRRVDCQDPQCAPRYSCAPAVPTGWIGPVPLYSGAAAPPSCGAVSGSNGALWAAQAIAGGTQIASPTAWCSACNCAAATGLTCHPPPIVFYSASDCTGTITIFTPSGFGQCEQPSIPAWYSVDIGVASSTGGSCVASGGSPDFGAPSFKTQAAACGVPPSLGAGCTDGVCAPKPPAGFGATYCIYLSGDVPCPSSPYTNKTVVFTSLMDNRSCSPCSCAAPTGSCSTNTSLEYNGVSDCANTTSGVVTSQGCYNAGVAFTLSSTSTVQNGNLTGQCTPSGGAVTGGASGAAPVTVCCQ